MVCKIFPKTVFTLVSAIFLSATATFAYASQDQNSNPGIKRFQDWTFVNPKKAGISCYVVQQVLSRKTGAKLLEVAIYPIKKADPKDRLSSIISVNVPTGADLVSGIAYRHVRGKKTAIGLEWQSCNPNRCTATGKITRKELKRLRRERSVVFGFRPLPTSRLLNVPLSLSGLSRAWREVRKC